MAIDDAVSCGYLAVGGRCFGQLAVLQDAGRAFQNGAAERLGLAVRVVRLTDEYELLAALVVDVGHLELGDETLGSLALRVHAAAAAGHGRAGGGGGRGGRFLGRIV